MSQKTTSLEIFLMRHAATEWSENGRHTGTTDLSLTELGKKQAHLLSTRLQLEKFDKVFCSPLKRAVETSDICGFTPEINTDLREWNYGNYEGLTRQQILEKDSSWNLFDKGAPGGETPAQVIHRARRFLQKIENLQGKIAIISSAHFLRIFVTQWVNVAPNLGKVLLLSPASISRLGSEYQKHVIICWNDIAHLGIR